jgi:hypothetical protein
MNGTKDIYIILRCGMDSPEMTPSFTMRIGTFGMIGEEKMKTDS